jgi:hypothetical protein
MLILNRLRSDKPKGAWPRRYRPGVEALEDRRLLTTLVALTSQGLVPFDSSTPNAADFNHPIPITGNDLVKNAESIVAIDVRPATGQLYGLGIGKKSGHLYTIALDGKTATAQLPYTGNPSLKFSSNASIFHMAFYPGPDQVRIVDDGGDNFRVDPYGGNLVTGQPFTLNGASFRIGAITYLDNDHGATTLYGLDLDHTSIVHIDDPDTGVAQKLDFVTPFTQNEGLDVAADGTFFAALVNASVDTNLRLYTITLNSTGTSASARFFPNNDATLSQIGGQPDSTFLSDLVALPPPTLQFGASVFTANEGDATATITVNRNGSYQGPVSVDYATYLDNGFNFLATPGVDYTATHGTLSWADGDTAPKSFTIPLMDDGGTDGLLVETVPLRLSNPTNPSGDAALSSGNPGLLNIYDDDGGSFHFGSANYSVAENAGTATITLVRTNGSEGPLSVNYATVDGGTAVKGTDYTPTSGTLSWKDGDATPKTFTIPILDDQRTDPSGTTSETVNLKLTSPITGSGALETATLTISESTFGQFQFDATSYRANETDGSATITVTRSAGSDGAVSVKYATSDGSAHAPTDYGATSGTLTFAAGETSKHFTVPIFDDGGSEEDGTVNLTLSGPTGGATLGPQSTATLTIAEPNAGQFQFAADNYRVDETSGNATITVTRTGGSDRSVSVSYATGDGTASAGTDYSAASGTLTFAPGETSKSLTIPIVDDGGGENAGTVMLALSSPTGGAILGAQNTATLTIAEPSPGQLQFDSGSYQANDTDGGATIIVTRTNGSDGAVSVNYAASNGTASAGVDFGATSGTLTFAAGETSKSFTVPILNDGKSDGSETVNLTLSSPSGGATLGSTASAVLTLNDVNFNATISGTVFQDINIDGVQDMAFDGTRTTPEPGIAGVTLYLDLDGSGVLKSTDPTAITDANGNFQFTVTSAGTYILREVLYGGVLLDAPASGSVQVTVANGSNITGRNFADVPTSIALPLTLPLTTPFPKQGDPVADFVEALYRAVLARDAEPGGLANWTDLLKSGQLTRQQVVQGIRQSPEHFQDEVTDFYFTILNRAPDPKGLHDWVQALENGVPEEQVATEFLDSGEYLSNGDKYFVDHMYEALLGRSFDKSGEANWLDTLGDDSSGNPTHPPAATHAQVVHDFLYSPESLNRLVEGYYQIFLGRLADPTGLASWLAALGQGQSFLTIGEGFLTSDEFYNNAAGQG